MHGMHVSATPHRELGAGLHGAHDGAESGAGVVEPLEVSFGSLALEAAQQVRSHLRTFQLFCMPMPKRTVPWTTQAAAFVAQEVLLLATV
jgi:hypothetical protein